MAVVVLMPPSDAGKAREKAASQVGISPRYVQDAKRLEQEAPALAAECKTGKKTITQAMREVKEAAREQRRDDNRVLIAKAPSPAQSAARYATIMIDPPWDWGDEGDADTLPSHSAAWSPQNLSSSLMVGIENLIKMQICTLIAQGRLRC